MSLQAVVILAFRSSMSLLQCQIMCSAMLNHA